MTDTISADTRIETFAYELASRRIASIPQSRNIDGQFKRPRRLTDDQREVLVLRIAVGLTAEMTASTLRTTRSSVLLLQHQALRAWTGLRAELDQTLLTRGVDGLCSTAHLEFAHDVADVKLDGGR